MSFWIGILKHHIHLFVSALVSLQIVTTLRWNALSCPICFLTIPGLNLSNKAVEYQDQQLILFLLKWIQWKFKTQLLSKNYCHRTTKKCFFGTGISLIFSILDTESFGRTWLRENTGQAMTSFNYTTSLKYLLALM